MTLPSPDEMRDKLAQGAAPEETKAFEELPPVTSIAIDVVGSRGKRYRHTFLFKVPNVGQQIEIGRLKSAYLPQGGGADHNAALLVEQLCYLEITLQKEQLPAWWKPFEMYDATPASALYAEAINYERRFHGAAADDEAGAAGADEGPHDAGPTPSQGAAAVGVHVPASTKRRTVLSTDAAPGD